MIKNNGFLMEEEFVNALNNKDPNSLPNNLNYFIKQLFGVFIDGEVIYCELVEGSQKPDIKITYKGIVKYVSLKTGKAQSVHEEYIEKFIPYLVGLATVCNMHSKNEYLEYKSILKGHEVLTEFFKAYNS